MASLQIVLAAALQLKRDPDITEKFAIEAYKCVVLMVPTLLPNIFPMQSGLMPVKS